MIEEVWPQTRGQRCWVHKTANVLNKLPNFERVETQALGRDARSERLYCTGNMTCS
jgi:transposase-like protein